MKRTEPRKSHSWWWDSHISPKNSRWLAENLEEMDQSVKRMLKLIEEDGDSFAKKADMYYHKRPELISHVEQFYRMYRSLAERYDHLTGELRKNLPSDLQSQSSGVSDIASELTSTWPSPDHKPLSRRKSEPRPAGFDVFLGSAGSSSDVYHKEGDELSSLTDSDSESDASSVNNYSVSSGNGGEQGLNRRIMELEIELREVKEKLRVQQQGDHVDFPRGGAKNGTADYLPSRIAGYEQDLRIANEKIKLSQEEITGLRMQLQKYKSLETCHQFESSGEENGKLQDDNGNNQPSERTGALGEDSSDSDGKVQVRIEELRIMREKLQNSEKEIYSLKLEGDEKIQYLKGELELVKKDAVTWKSKANAEKREVSKLQERIARLRTSLSDRDHEIRDLKIAVSDAEEKIFPEKAHIKAEISKLLDERTCLEGQVREWESRGRWLEEEIRKVVNERRESEERGHAEIQQLKENLDGLKREREEVDAKVESLKAEVRCRDEQMNEMEKHLNKLRKEHEEVLGIAEGARKEVEELRWRAKELDEEIERQRVIILEGAEEKREAIRQLCFSLEHYRNRYDWLRQAFEQKRVPAILAS
ncbi:hypothetical protein SLA2020_521040 [Shorea laevis]